MTGNNLKQKFEITDACRSGFLEYTRKAFAAIPKIENPRILDLGCGSGVPCLEMAKLTNGNILAIDSDPECLEWLKHKIRSRNLEERITVVHGSALNADLPPAHFDIILAEGFFNVVGFGRVLKYFTRNLKSPGYFMIHDDQRQYNRKLSLFKKYGLTVVSSFLMDERVWWDCYYRCLEKAIREFEAEQDRNLHHLFESDKTEIRMFRKNPSGFRSRYYVLEKTG